MKRNRKDISLDVDSALAIMQEIYLDVNENRNTANIIMKKMLKFMKESEDMALIGPVIKDQQKIINDCTEKKISLVKLQNNLLKLSSNPISGGGGSNGILTEEDKRLISEMMSEEDNETYDNESN